VEQLNPHIRPVLAKLMHRRRQDVSRHERSNAERYGLVTTLGRAPDARDCGIEFLEATLDNRQQLAAMGRQLDVTCRAIEQPEPDAAFQFANQDAQTRGRYEERLGGTREIAMVCNETKRAELPGADFHY